MILLTHAPEEREIFYCDEAVAGFRALGEVRLNPLGRPLAGADFIAAAAGCSIIVGDSKASGNAELFEASPDLVAYVHGHVDLRRVDVAAASAHGILVTHASAAFGPAVSELVIGFMIDLTRGITASTMRWRSGDPPRTAISAELTGRTVGIIGYGHIGRHLAKLASAFGMRILVNDPYVDLGGEPGILQVTLDHLLRDSDFVVPLAVATPQTRNLIDAVALKHMKPTAFLINVSRGDLIDEAALAEALDRGMLAGAALDVGMAPFQIAVSHPRLPP